MRLAMHSAYAPSMRDAYASLQCIRAMHVRTHALTKIFVTRINILAALTRAGGREIFAQMEAS